VAGDAFVGHADGGGEAAEEKAAGLEDAPEIVQHGVEVRVVAGEVEDSAAKDDIEGGVGVGDGLDGFEAEIFCREIGGDGAGLFDGGRIFVRSEDFVAFVEEIDEVASGAAAGVEDPHAGCDVAAKELIEEVDVNLAELLLEIGHGL